MFIDASAVVAIVNFESEHSLFAGKIDAAPRVIVSPVTIYEATLALARLAQTGVSGGRKAVRAFVETTQARIVPIDGDVGELAIDAFERFGKGRHRAGLNMGDCFSYACAKVHRVPLLFKGDDFIHTDVVIA
jgi:ribonuclease VapC